MPAQTDATSRLAAESEASFEGWRQNWRAQALIGPPLIAPARQFVYPQQIAGEEDALARGAFQLLLYPAAGGSFLATCVRGFKDSAMPTGIFACPNADEFCAIAGGYAYVVNATQPATCAQVELRPVVDVRALVSHQLLLFVGFHHMLAWGVKGVAWTTARLSWEGIRLGEVAEDQITGFGWDLLTDKEVPFSVDLRCGKHTGGVF